MPQKTTSTPQINEKALSAILNNLDDHAFLTVYSDNRIASWTPSAERLLGYEQDEVTEKDLAVVLSIDNLKEETLKEAATEGLAKLEAWITKKGGNRITCSLIFAPIINADDLIDGYSVVVKDLSNAKDTENQLHINEEISNRTIDSNMGCVKILDAEALLLGMNEAGRCLMEIDDFDLLKGKKWVTLWPIEYHSVILEAIDKAKAGGIGHFQGFCPTTKGTPKWWDVVVSPIVDTQGNIVKLISISRDITKQRQAEEDLIYQEALLKAQNDATQDGIVIISPEDKILYYNQSFLDIWSIPKELAETKDDKAALQHAMHQVVDPQGFIDRINYLYKHTDEISHEEVEFKDGRTIERFGVPVKGTDGTYFGWAWYFRDITSRKQAEQIVSKNERRFRALTEKSNEVTSLISSKGKIVYTSPAITNILGYSVKEYQLVDDPFELIHPNERSAIQNIFLQLLNKPGSTITTEFRYKHKDGNYLWFEGNATNLLKDDSVNAVVANFREITKRKKAQEELKQQLELNKIITDNATTGLFIMNDQQRCTFMNPAAEKLAGLTFEEIQKRNAPLHDIVHHTKPDGSHYPMMECPIDRALPEKYQTQGEDIFVKPDGSFYPVAFTASPIIRGGKPVGTVIEVRDTSEEKERERKITMLNKNLEKRVEERTQELKAANKELERSNAELEDFAYVASHDLQEPLRKITAFSTLLKSDYGDAFPEDARPFLDGLQKSSLRMRTLINDLLAYSRVTTQTQPFKKVDLTLVANDAIEDLQIRIEDTNATVEIKDLCTIYGDELQLRLLFQNFISNALKYRKKDVSPIVKVSSEQKDGLCLIHIQDNGIGFNEAYSGKIFTLFQRLHGKSEYEGTGIGLAICKKIVSRHNGEIDVSSKEGEGSTFTIKLPLKQK